MSADAGVETTITLTLEDGIWVATDEEIGVASQGETREEVLVNLDEAVALHTGEIGEPVTDEDLEELGIDPDDVQEPDAPWFDESPNE